MSLTTSTISTLACLKYVLASTFNIMSFSDVMPSSDLDSSADDLRLNLRVRTTSPRSTVCLTGVLYRPPTVNSDQQPMTALLIRHQVLATRTVQRPYQREFNNVIEQADSQASTFYASVAPETAALTLHLAKRIPDFALESNAALCSYPTEEWLSGKLQEMVSIFACSAATIMERTASRQGTDRSSHCPNICVVKPDLWQQWSKARSRVENPLAFQKHFRKVETASSTRNKMTWAALNQEEPLSRMTKVKVFCEMESGRVIDLGELADDTSSHTPPERRAIAVDSEEGLGEGIDWNLGGVNLEDLLKRVTDNPVEAQVSH